MKQIDFFKIVKSFIDDFDIEEDLLEIRSTNETTDYLFGNFDDLLLTELFTKYKVPLAVVQDISDEELTEYKVIKKDVDLDNYSFTCQLVDSVKFPKNSHYRLYVGFLITLDNED